jgi:hypothetical protein
MMAKQKQTSKKKQTTISYQEHENYGIFTKLWGILVKFTGFWIVVVREMAYTSRLVYKNFYSKDSTGEMINSSSENHESYPKIVCPICNREFNNDDPVVKCPEKGCGEIYHYICWHFSHGCIQSWLYSPGLLSQFGKSA